MSSGFVPAGSDPGTAPNPVPVNDEWTRAREQINSIRRSKPVVPGEQDGGKSLYEVLQANKAAKQEAFEESSKLRNQFRALDDDEIDFLESVRESERTREAHEKQQTADELETFRKQRAAAEQALREGFDKHTDTNKQDGDKVELWAATKKRRRAKADEPATSSKLRKNSTLEQSQRNHKAADQPLVTSVAIPNAPATQDPDIKVTSPTGQPLVRNEKFALNQAKTLGLDAYGSDSDDE